MKHIQILLTTAIAAFLSGCGENNHQNGENIHENDDFSFNKELKHMDPLEKSRFILQ